MRVRVLHVLPLLLACATSDPDAPLGAAVIAVDSTGTSGAFTVGVTVRSPDTGCDRYADWWEVLAEDGTLVYRRILAHSHPGEQPFRRTGGPVPIQGDTVVVVRAHLAPGGYGTDAMRGSVDGGFSATTLAADWAADVAILPPQPDGCAF